MVDLETSVQSVARSAAILRLLAVESIEGWRLSDVATKTGLRKATTHRLLSALVNVGFVYQDPADRRYRLGYEIVRLGLAATRYDIVDLARPAMIRLARKTEDTVFVSVREGREAICLDRQVGAFPIKTLTLNGGDHRPLGVGAGSLALLAFLPDDEVEEVIQANRPALVKYPKFSPHHLRELVARTRAAGFAFNDGRIVSAMSAVGVPVWDPHGRLVAALSVAAINERMSPSRIRQIVAALQEEAAQLKARLAAATGPARPGEGARRQPAVAAGRGTRGVDG